MERLPRLADSKISVVKVVTLLKAAYRVSVIVIKTPKIFFTEKQPYNSHRRTRDPD